MTEMTARIWPLVFAGGDSVQIRVENIPVTAREAVVDISYVDSVETQWCASVPLTLHGDGQGNANYESQKFSRQAAVYVDGITIDGVQTRLPLSSFAICDPPDQLRRNDAAVHERYEEIAESQKARYSTPLGDPTAPGVREFRAAHIISGLLLTSTLRLPTASMFGLAARPEGLDAAALVEAAAVHLDWPARTKQPTWSDIYSRDHPISVLVFPSVFAESVGEVLEICRRERDHMMSVLALSRGARGLPVVTMIEERDGDSVGPSKFAFDHQNYQGNLVGGPLAGESQLQLLVNYSAIGSDALVKLCVDLFAEALSDNSKDAKFFRYWSAIETLAIGRVQPDQRLPTLERVLWPDGLHTGHAEPRVYQLIVDLVFSGANRVDQASFATPAPDLFTLVRAWYARRNATAHYGRFIPGSPLQTGARWYARALSTQPSPHEEDEWLRSIRNLCSLVLAREAARIGAPLI